MGAATGVLLDEYKPSTQAGSLQESLENTLLINTVKLFSVLAKSDDEVSEAELQYVQTYLSTIYHKPVADYLFEQFERFVQEDIDEAAAAAQIRTSFSYENRVFILMKVYELAASDRVEDSERETARRIGTLIGVSYEDICFVETVYDLPTGVTIETSQKTSIDTLRIGDTTMFSDIVLPMHLLDVEIFRTGGIYILLPKNNRHAVLVDDTQVAGEGFPNLLNATKIQHNQRVTIGGYTINFEDLNYYYELKTKALLGIALFVSKRSAPTGEVDYVLSEMPGLDNVLLIEFTKLLIMLTPLDSAGARLLVGGQLVESQMNVNLNDMVMIDNCPINLRKLAFQYGLESELFKIPLDHDTYTVGNYAGCDVLYDDALTTRWALTITRTESAGGQVAYTLHPKNCPHRVAFESKVVRSAITLPPECNVIVGKQVLQLNFLAGTCRVEPFRFKDFIARQIRYRFQDNSLAIDDISFEIDYGDLVCVIGPSGSGKSTLLNIINGYDRPNEGAVELNSYDLHLEYSAIKDYLGYVPQDDLVFENLTVAENLRYNAKLRHPEQTDAEIEARVEQVLTDIDLYEKRHIKAGSPTQRTLSGGQRKRLNIGLELLSDADVYFLDEPTSGLSSKDSEKIIELLQRLTFKGKIIFVVIHQPSSKIYRMFDKILFLDKGGKMAFFGDVLVALAYFRNHNRSQHLDPATLNIAEQAAAIANENIEPDVLLATLEEPLRDIDGIPLPKRKYSPDYWKERYARFRRSVRRLNIEDTQRIALPPPDEPSLREQWKQFTTLLARNFLNKLRDRSNLLITFLEAPALALAVGVILRHKSGMDANYTLFQNDNMMIFIFLAVVIVMFLAITNSIDDIIKDAAILLRERMLNISNASYYASKFITLVAFSIVQNALFLLAAFPVLAIDIPSMFVPYLLFLTVVSLNSIAIGLLISSIPNLSAKASFNIVPLILIPQIIFGGALIPYSEMDHLKINPDAEIPEICQVIPSRWAYEGLMTLQDGFNRFQPRDDSLQTASKLLIQYHDAQDSLRTKRAQLLEKFLENSVGNAAENSAKKPTESPSEESPAANANANANDIALALANAAKDPAVAPVLAQLDVEIAAWQTRIEARERERPLLDSLAEAHRTEFQDKHGNQEIHRQVNEARDKIHAAEAHILAIRHDSIAAWQAAGKPVPERLLWYDYPMISPLKPIRLALPIVHWGTETAKPRFVRTVFFNSLVLLIFTVIIALLALALLAGRGWLLDKIAALSRFLGNTGLLRRAKKVKPDSKKA
jgi:ABC transport system ATP-binding/permease protein